MTIEYKITHSALLYPRIADGIKYNSLDKTMNHSNLHIHRILTRHPAVHMDMKYNRYSFELKIVSDDLEALVLAAEAIMEWVREDSNFAN
jgi:hypothetical protein